jgi:hypothetical protein
MADRVRLPDRGLCRKGKFSTFLFELGRRLTGFGDGFNPKFRAEFASECSLNSVVEGHTCRGTSHAGAEKADSDKSGGVRRDKLNVAAVLPD